MPSLFSDGPGSAKKNELIGIPEKGVGETTVAGFAPARSPCRIERFKRRCSQSMLAVVVEIEAAVDLNDVKNLR